MKKLLLIVVLLVSKNVAAEKVCSSISETQFKTLVVQESKVDKLIKPIDPKSRITIKTGKNCYKNVVVSYDSNADLSKIYLLDAENRLVNIQNLRGSNELTCKHSSHISLEYYLSKLDQLRVVNKYIPKAINVPRGAYIRQSGCVISLFEAFQDDVKKPLLVREWKFDQYDNLIDFSGLNRSQKVYPDDPVVK